MRIRFDALGNQRQKGQGDGEMEGFRFSDPRRHLFQDAAIDRRRLQEIVPRQQFVTGADMIGMAEILRPDFARQKPLKKAHGLPAGGGRRRRSGPGHRPA